MTDSLEGTPKLRRTLSKSRSSGLRKKVEKLMIDDINQAIEDVAESKRTSTNINPVINVEPSLNENQELSNSTPNLYNLAPLTMQHAVSESIINTDNSFQDESLIHEPGSLFHSQSVDDLLSHDIDGLKRCIKGSIRYKRQHRQSINFDEIYENLQPLTPPPVPSRETNFHKFTKNPAKKPLPLPRIRSVKEKKKQPETKKIVYILDKQKDHFVLESEEKIVVEAKPIVVDVREKDTNSQMVQFRKNLRPVSLHNSTSKMRFVYDKSDRPISEISINKGCKSYLIVFHAKSCFSFMFNARNILLIVLQLLFLFI